MRGKGDPPIGDNTRRIIPEGSRVLETVTERGKFKIQDVSDDAILEAKKMSDDPEEHKQLLEMLSDIGIPGSHQFPSSELGHYRAPSMRELDVVDADGNALMRVYARPDYDVVDRIDNYFDYINWIERIADFAPEDQFLKQTPMMDGVEIVVPRMEQIWPDRPWKVDVKGFKPQDQVDRNLLINKNFGIVMQNSLKMKEKHRNKLFKS